MRRCRPLLLLVVLSAGFAPAPLPRADRRPKPPHEMVGLWTGGGGDLLITADRMTYNPGPERYEYALTVNPNTSPPSYDILGVVQNRNAGWQFSGIYRVQGDTLTLCYDSGKGTRPASFDGQGRRGIVETYKRKR
jgi:uncharacterized protein (TIGR03067 family)